MIEHLTNSLIKIIGSVNPDKETVINGIECFKNKQETIIKVDCIKEAEQILGNDFILLDKFNPYGIMMKTIFDEYPYLIILKNEIELSYPNKFYYQHGKPLIVEYNDCCYIFCNIKKGYNI